MPIDDWPSADRPREKLLAAGAKALSESELLAIWLGTGTRGASAVELARGLLTDFGSLRALLVADQDRLCRHRGIGAARYAQLQAALELARRHHLEALKAGPPLTSPRLAGDYLRAELRDRDYEVFCCLYLDSRHRLTGFEELFAGTIDGASVHPREVVKRALARRAAAVILAHNHPSGVAEPSRADEVITQRLRDALALVDIRVVDHLIVGEGACVSLAERGLL
ncbi:MAG: DNA repair protein RadC [Proteobacteria bacterium]|nr:DNA repair protein RadC [Pseudomonadota bacterium]